MAVLRFVRRNTRCFIVGVLALAGLATIETWPASSQSSSQSRGDQRASGRMTLGGPDDGAAAPLSPTIPQSVSQSVERNPAITDPAASRLLASARRDLAQGNAEIARRVLEQLIARYPESPSAKEARRELDAMDAARRGAAANSSADKLPDLPRTDLPSPRVSAWRTTVIHFTNPQEELRNGIGDRVFFSAGSADLGSRARAVIAAQAEWLQIRPDLEIVVEGHADDRAAGADDEGLAASRALAVRDRLTVEGLAPTRIRIVPQGSRDPIATCDDDTCSAQNRRVVVQVALPRSQLPDDSNAASGLDTSSRDRPR